MNYIMKKLFITQTDTQKSILGNFQNWFDIVQKDFQDAFVEVEKENQDLLNKIFKQRKNQKESKENVEEVLINNIKFKLSQKE